jgi:hypothetical protein
MASLAEKKPPSSPGRAAIPKRGEIDDLMDVHRKNLDTLRERLGDVLADRPEGAGTKYDDIFLLRYLLSNAKNPNSEKGLDLAEGSIRRTVAWREENADILKQIQETKKAPFDDTWRSYMGVFRSFQKNKGPINFVVVDHSSTKALMDDHPFEKVQQFCLFTREDDFQICDRLTRETRKLVKTVTVVDLYGMSVFSGDADKRFAKALGDSSNISSDLYPQFLLKTIVINLPSVFNWIWKILKLFMSERSLSKITLHPLLGHGADPADTGELSSLVNVDKENVPDFLGGNFDTTKALSHTKQRQADTVTITIPSRTSNECRLRISEAGTMIAYLVKVENKNVIMNAKIINDGPELTLFESRKVNATEGTITGNWVAPLAGTLVITFDNSYSMLRSKTVRYCIKVVSKQDANLDGLLAASAGTESD